MAQIKPTNIDHQVIDDVRAQWNIGSQVQVYSDSQKKWIIGKVIKISNDNEGEWLHVEYGQGDNKKTKEIQRFSEYLQSIDHNINTNVISSTLATATNDNPQNDDNDDDIDDNIINDNDNKNDDNKMDIDNDNDDDDDDDNDNDNVDLPQRRKRGKRRNRHSAKDVNNQKIIRNPREKKYEYLDHTADIQLHSWGKTIKEAFEQIGIAMFGYMTELDKVEYVKSFEIIAKGHDMESLLYHFLDELLVTFSCEDYLLFKDVEITEFDRKNFKIKATGYGENMDLKKHPQGTEVKAITYSAMQIKEIDTISELWVVVDI